MSLRTKLTFDHCWDSRVSDLWKKVALRLTGGIVHYLLSHLSSGGAPSQPALTHFSSLDFLRTRINSHVLLWYYIGPAVFFLFVFYSGKFSRDIHGGPGLSSVIPGVKDVL